MLGHVLYTYLDGLEKYELFNIVFRDKLNEKSIILDVNERMEVERQVREIDADILINCIGVLIKGSNLDYANAIYINSFFPHFLSKLMREGGGRLIHVSTDCVFSGKCGSYVENDIKDAEDVYGKSKGLGEVINERDLTIRTSIIGPELKENGEGLMHWLFKQNGSISGYDKAIWSGVTTLQLAKAIDIVIVNKITGLYHITNGIKISKYDLLLLIKKVWNLECISINKVDGKKIDKSLVDSRKEINIPEYKEMFEKMKLFMINNRDFYKQYEKII